MGILLPAFPLAKNRQPNRACDAGNHGPVQRTELLSTEPMTVLVDVTKQVVQAPSANHIA
jgi:hypothetical protein